MTSFIVSSVYALAAELYTDSRLKAEEKVVIKPLLDVFDKVRELHGAPIHINSGRRTVEHQAELTAQGYRTATTSPHVYGVALDPAVPDGKTDEYLVALIFGAAKILGLPQPRVGWMKYRDAGKSSTFVHYDFAFLLSPDVMLSLPKLARSAWSIEGLVW